MPRQQCFTTFKTLCVYKMTWFSKPQCEGDFESAHRHLRYSPAYRNSLAAREQWVIPFLDEEKLGIAIFQRQHCLLQKQLAEQQSNNDDEKPKPPQYIIRPSTAKVKTLKQELAILNGQYWEHQMRLGRLIRCPWRMLRTRLWLL